MDYEFKHKNENKVKEVKVIEVKEEVKTFKTKNPSYVWSDQKPRKYNLEKMLENLEDEYKDKCSGVKSEFVSNTEKGRINLKNAKKKASKTKDEREN